MAQTLDQINALRSYQGLEDLTELPAENTGVKVEGTLAEETKEVIIDIELGKASESSNKETATSPEVVKTEKEENIEKPETQTLATVIVPELGDDVILEALKKRGINVTSFEDLAPKPNIDPEKEAEEREAAKLSFALSKGLFAKKEYENFIRDSQDPKNLVYGEYYAEAKKEDEDLTDEDIQANFLAEYGLDSTPESGKYKRGVKNLALIADKMLKEKYGKIYNSDQEFEKYENQQNSDKEYKKNIISKAPLYKRDVEDAVKEITKIIIPFSDKESIEASFKPEHLEKVKNLLLDEGYSLDQINKGWSKENLKQVAYTALVRENLSEIVKDVATKYLYKHQAGTKGVPTGGQIAGVTDSEAHLTEDQRTAISFYRERLQIAEGAN